MAAKKKTPIEEVVEEVKVEDGVPESPPALDAVVVIKEKGEDGAISTRIMLNGGVEATEVQTLLELAVKGWREQIGLTV